MNRAKFLKSCLLLASLPSLGLLALESFKKESGNKCYRVTEILFPEGKTFSNFQSDIDLWMNKAAWINFLEKAKFEGLLLEHNKEIFSNKVVYTYVFSSHENYNKFINLVDKNVSFSQHQRENLGYLTKVKIIT